MILNHCPSTPAALHNLELRLKGEKMDKKEPAWEDVSRKISLRLEIKRKGGAVSDVAFLLAVLKGLPDHPRHCNLKNNLLDSPEFYRTDMGDFCIRIIQISKTSGGPPVDPTRSKNSSSGR